MWSKASRVLPSVKVLLLRLQDTFSDSYLSFKALRQIAVEKVVM